MTSDSPSGNAKYSVGQLIHHTLFDYRGVIVDVDSDFRIGAELNAAEQRPPANRIGAQPWYHVLVDGTADRTYVAERNLEPDPHGGPVEHPDLIDYFEGRTQAGYIHCVRMVN